MTTATLTAPAALPRPGRPTRNETPSVTIPPSAHTLDGFRAWAHSGDVPTTCRVTFVAGKVIVDMSPERVGSHSGVKMEVSSALYRLVREGDLGRFFPDGTLVSNRPADVSNEPDAIYVSHSTFAEGRARLVPSADGRDFVEIEGSPDMILEVVSPSSVSKDTVQLRERYHLARVTEYWLIDARGDEIAFDVFRRSPDGYESTPAADGWFPSTVFARRFRLEPTRDRAGLWQYTLHLAPLDPAAP